MKRKLLLSAIIIYLIFLFDYTIIYSNKNKKVEYKIEYRGLVWVGLDYWSILKYQSNDKPMKWLDYEVKHKII